jgi:hypothetical protein
MQMSSIKEFIANNMCPTPSIYMPFINRLNDYLQSSSFLWSRYIFGWIIVGVILIIDVTWLFMSHYSVQMGGIITSLKVVGFLLCWAVGFRGLTLIPRYKLLTKKLRYAEVSETASWFMLLSCFTSVAYVGSYLSVTVNAPLVDTSLVLFDRTLGFDWVSVYHWVHSHPIFKHILELAYESMVWQMVAVPAILGLMRRQDNLSEFVQHIMLSSILLLIISTLFPAESAFVHFHVTDPNTASTVSNFNLLRNGTMRVIDTLHVNSLPTVTPFSRPIMTPPGVKDWAYPRSA